MTRLAISLALLICVAAGVSAQTPLPLTPRDPATGEQPRLIHPLTQPTLSPGVLQLMELDSRFSQDVVQRGGKAFASWFAEDAVVLNNGKPAVLGIRSISNVSQWDPKIYRLSWSPQGAQMGPSGDTGFTWGHYDAHTVDQHGEAVDSSGRYITFWKKVADGTWKVALDAGANDAPAEGDCCALPKP